MVRKDILLRRAKYLTKKKTCENPYDFAYCDQKHLTAGRSEFDGWKGLIDEWMRVKYVKGTAVSSSKQETRKDKIENNLRNRNKKKIVMPFVTNILVFK